MEKMKILHLPLMAKWYEMIERGEKLEEYREDKPFWRKRLMECFRSDKNGCADAIFPKCRQCFCTYGASKPGKFKKFDAVKFRYGYTKRTMTFRIKNIRFGKGKKEWGAGSNDVFIIELGERIKEGEV